MNNLQYLIELNNAISFYKNFASVKQYFKNYAKSAKSFTNYDAPKKIKKMKFVSKIWFVLEKRQKGVRMQIVNGDEN